MANPLRMFRRYQKQLIVVFGILLMVAFTAGTAIQSISSFYGTPGGAGYGNEPVVRWKHGKISEMNLDRFRIDHLLTMNFLTQLVQLASSDQGQPKDAILIPAALQAEAEGTTFEEALVRRMTLAKMAEEMNITIDSQAVEDYLGRLCDQKIVDSQGYLPIASQATNGRMSYREIVEHLRVELAAEQLSSLGRAGFSTNSPNRPSYAAFVLSPEAQYFRSNLMMGLHDPITLPATAYDYHQRVHEKVDADVLPVRVEDYTDKVEREPTDAELREIFEAGKNRFPQPGSAEPGFKIRHKIAFDYFRADYDQYLLSEKKKITDEQVLAYYEANKETYRIVDSSTDAPQTSATESEAAGDTETSPPREESEDSQSAAEPADGSGNSDDGPGPSESDEGQPNETEKSDDGQGTEEAGSGDDSDDENPPNPDRVQGDSAAGESSDAADQLLAQLPTEATEDQAGSSDTAEEQTEPAAAEPSGATPEKTPAEERTGEAATQEPAAQTQQPEAGPPQSEAGPPQPEAGPPQPEAAETGGDASESNEPEEGSQSPPEPKYKSVDEAREQILDNLAGPEATKQMERAIDAARGELRKYYLEYLGWKQQDDESEQPRLPDMQSLADRLGLVYQQIPLGDILEVRGYEIGSSLVPEYDQDRILYQAQEIPGPRSSYLYWKTDENAEEKGKVPEFDEVKDQVLDVWRLREATKMAREAAEQKADQVRQSGSSLSELFGDDVTQTGEFSWLSAGGGNVAFGGGQLSLTDVRGVEGAGREFMEAVFALEEGGVTIASNVPKSVFYVVQVNRRQLTQDYGQPGGPSDPTTAIARQEQEELYVAWIEELEREMDIQWQRDPR